MLFYKSILTVLVALVASISIAGPVRLATSFFIPAGRTNPVILDAKADASGNLVTAAQADFGGGKQIIITKFNAAGVRRWASTINTPVPVTASGQVAGKFQIMLDGVGNTYVLSARDGNPAVSGTSQDILLRKINDSGVTVGYLSLAGYLVGHYSVAMNVTNAQMQGLPTGENVCVSFTGVTVSDSVSSAYIVLLRGGTSGSAITVDAIQVNDGVYFPGAGRINYSVIGLKPGEETVDGPQLRWLYKLEQRFENPILSEETTYLNCSTEITPTGFSLAIAFPYVVASRIGFEAEGAGSTSDQVAITTKD